MRMLSKGFAFVLVVILSSPVHELRAADITAPTVSITVPVASATISGTNVTISANAADNIGLTGVLFKLDASTIGVEDTTAPYSVSLDSTKVINGSHLISALARDAAGNTKASLVIPITIDNGGGIPRIVTLYKSAEGSGTVTGGGMNCGDNCSATVAQGASITLTATPSTASVFLNWGGACSGNSTTCTFTPTASTVVTALFQTEAAMNGPTANGVLEPGEACDGDDLGGISTIPGFRPGNLKCRSDRKGYDISGLIAGSKISAKSCSHDDVQAAIDSAEDGDTILVPAGTCTWTSPLRIGTITTWAPRVYSNPSIILKGAGIGLTTIKDSLSTGTADMWQSKSAIHVLAASAKPVRITGFTFDGSASAVSNAIIALEGDRIGSSNRVDHCAFVNVTTRAISVSTFGIIDHNQFIRTTNHAINVTLVSVFGDGAASWTRPYQYGTAAAAYFEDNVFDQRWPNNGPYDNYVGDRYVFRRNKLYGSHLGHHGYDSATSGNMGYEVYENTIINESPSGVPYVHDSLIENRSGTGVIYGNTVKRSPFATVQEGYYDNFAYLKNYRSSDGYPWGATGVAYSSFCNGTIPVDGNSPGMQGYPCKDQIGRTADQKLSPTYAWNNSFERGKSGAAVVAGHLVVGGYSTPPPGGNDRYNLHIVEGRDFYNTPKPGYRPYSYPHPLVTLDPVIPGNPSQLKLIRP